MNDTNKLNGDDWVRLLKVFPQFAPYCNWEKLSRKNWIDLLEARPEFADKCGDIQLVFDVFAKAQYKPIQRDIEALIESQNIERKERLWTLIPLGISFLLWGVGCIAFYCERATTVCASTTPFGLALAPGLPWADEPSPRNLRFSTIMIPT